MTEAAYVDQEALDRAWGDYPYDLRGTPKGEATRWDAERLVLRPGYTRRTRERLKIAYCADGWYSDSGGPTHPFGDGPTCRCIEERKLWHRYDELHPEPVVWRIQADFGRRRLLYWYCDAYLPRDLRDLASKERQ